MTEEITERPEPPEAVKERPPTLDQQIIERFGFPSDWEHNRWKKHGMDRQGNYKFIEFFGGVYRTKITRGPRKGEPNYRKPEPDTEYTVTLLKNEVEDWIAKWVSDTGYCNECWGTGYSVSGWSVQCGTRYRSCRKCSGTGQINKCAAK